MTEVRRLINHWNGLTTAIAQLWINRGVSRSGAVPAGVEHSLDNSGAEAGDREWEGQHQKGR